MTPLPLLRNWQPNSFLKRLVFPVCLGLPIAIILQEAVQFLDIRALTLLLICVSFTFFSIIFRCFERAVFGCVFFLVPINVDINFEIGPSLYALRLPLGTILLNLSLIDIAILTLYPMWIVRVLAHRGKERITWPAGATAILLYTAWGALSMLNSPNQLLSALEVACFLKTFLCFFYLANNLKTRENIWFAVRCLLAGFFLQSLIGLAQQSVHRNIGLGFLGERKEEKMMKMVGGKDPVFRIGGTLGHPTFFGGYMAAVLPVSLAMTLFPMRLMKRAIPIFIFMCGAMALIFSYCRSAWIVTFFSCPFLLYYWFRDYFRTHQFRLGPILGVALIGACVLLPFAPQINERLTADDKGSTESRIPQWKMGFEMIKAHPFLGVGMNNYNVVSDRYEPYVADESTPTRVFFYGSKIHNVYLGVASQTGLIGLFFYLLFLWQVIQHGWKKIKIVEDKETALLLTGVVLGVTGLLVHESMHTGNISGNMPLWILVSFLAGPILREALPEKAPVSYG